MVLLLSNDSLFVALRALFGVSRGVFGGKSVMAFCDDIAFNEAGKESFFSYILYKCYGLWRQTLWEHNELRGVYLRL